MWRWFIIKISFFLLSIKLLKSEGLGLEVVIVIFVVLDCKVLKIFILLLICRIRFILLDCNRLVICGFDILLIYLVGFVIFIVLYMVFEWVWIDIIFCFKILMWLDICSVKLCVVVVGVILWVLCLNNVLLMIDFMVWIWVEIEGCDKLRLVVVFVIFL